MFMQTHHIIKPPESRVLKSGRVRLSPGEEIGEHVTDKREEIIIILKGTATLEKGNETIQLNPGQTHFIKENVTHNVRNMSDQDLEYLYVVSLF